MGILNLTPDSFFDGGKLDTEKNILSLAEKMLNDGATFLDLGGYSSRPGAHFVSEKDELLRVLPVVKLLLKEFPNALLSIDTFRSKIAKQCVETGAAIVNDISGGNQDPAMLETIAALKVPYILMHMRGTPKTMMKDTKYENITIDLLKYFSEKIAKAHEIGINDVIADPGFGFAKTRRQNFELINNLELFDSLDVPILIGVSRKSLVYKTLDITPDDALNGTTALHSIAIYKGVSLLRTHDVKEAVECINLIHNLKSH